ncbi:putative flavin dependent monooxygenase [Aspergillus lucknowensis]|uniref:Flavin dependent monooxygenase n=1 Tax=Aspergillus lucknowensis TaxID=176173 RepID=A0ABR4LIS9_9EURO
MAPSKQIRRIAVIGAGPSGLAAVKYLLAEKCFETIDVFEKRSYIGGVWNHCPGALKESASTPVPQLSPNGLSEEPTWLPKAGSQEILEPTFISPVYDTLDTNLPKELMAYGEKQFPLDAQDFPTHITVKKYVSEYGEGIKELIQFGTQVTDVRRDNEGTTGWLVTTRNLLSGTRTTKSYDAVVAANGHFDVPYLPDIPGVEAWNAAYPGAITHSRSYDSPAPFTDKKVIVIGSSASGLDIGNQINQVCKGKVLASQRTDLYLSPSTATDKAYYPEILEFLPAATHERAVRFADGRIENDIDSIVFCTGFLYSFPFLSSLNPPIITHGRRVQNTYQHLFYIYNPTLVFPVLAQRVVPFPLSENQAAVFSRVWSGRLSLPTAAEMEAWEASTVAEKGDGPAFHLLPFPLDANYMNMLHEWATTAKPHPDLNNNGNGKGCNHWGEKEKWMRGKIHEMREAFFSKGEERRSIKSLEQLGYDFERWQNE